MQLEDSFSMRSKMMDWAFYHVNMCNFHMILFQVVIVGNGAVGKSSMIQRYCRGTFTKSYKKTIGVDFLEKQLRIHGEDVRLMLWDTAGQEEFDAITKAYYRYNLIFFSLIS